MAFSIRGHTLVPKVSVKNKPEIKLSDLHQRVIWVLYRAGLTMGSELALDNLYNSVRFSHLFEAGVTFVIDIPAGWTADIDFDGNEKARVVEWLIKGLHIVGTLRGNRGAEAAHRFPDKVSKADHEALIAKPLMERVKVAAVLLYYCTALLNCTTELHY